MAMRSRTLTLVVVLSILGQLHTPSVFASAARAASLGSIAVRASDLGHSARLVHQGRFVSHVRGQRAGQTWTFTRAARMGLVKLENWVAHYSQKQYAAEAVLVAGERGCGSKGSRFGFHELTPGIGDFAEGCYYPATVDGVSGAPAVVITLRRGTYVTLLRAYAKAGSNEPALEAKVVHLATIVDRRIELAGHPSQQGSVPKRPSVQIIACRRPCLFSAKGRGSTLYSATFGRGPRAWRFAPGGEFNVSFQFDCGHIIRDRPTFVLTQLQDTNDRLTLREEPDQRNHDTVTSLPANGARLVMLNVQVQNNSCVWQVRATRYINTQP